MGLLNILFGPSSKGLSDYIAKGAIILDVRSDGEYQSNHISTALHIPLNELEYRVDEVIKLNKPVIVHCASGMRSENGAKFLRANGVDAINGGGIAKVKAAL